MTRGPISRPARERPASGSRGWRRVDHGCHPPADDRRVRLRSGRIRGVHQRDQQQQGDRQAGLEHQPEQQRSRSGTTTSTPSGTRPPHPFVLSFANTGRGPNESSLPFQKSGYAINNNLHSFALELNSRSTGFANRFFASYNRFRDFREPFSEDFPTMEIGEGGVTYTTLGHEPFSIHNILDQDVFQLTNNFSLFRGQALLHLRAPTSRSSGSSIRSTSSGNGVFFLPAGHSAGQPPSASLERVLRR